MQTKLIRVKIEYYLDSCTGEVFDLVHNRLAGFYEEDLKGIID